MPPDSETRTDAPARDNLRGGAWLIADLALNTWSLALVKWLGAEYPAPQLVFLRALVGFLLILPLIWRGRAAFHALPDLALHILRIALAVVTLMASFFAISRVPLATFTAIGFTRPIITMVMAALLLREAIGRRRWLAAAIAFVGVLIAVNPTEVPWNAGLAALVVVVFAGSATVVATRRLRDAPVIVMMAFYTAGLTICSLPFALAGWEPVAAEHVVPLVLIGAFAQVAQLCFLRAHFFGSAGFLSVLSYLSLVFSVAVGILFFDEVPGLGFAIGATFVVGAALWVTSDPRSLRPRS